MHAIYSNVQSGVSPAMTSQTVTSAVTALTNRRHMVAVTQLILILAVYLVSFVPLVLVINGLVDGLVMYFYHINHISNFFIYLIVNREFRKEAKRLVNVVNKALRPNAPAVFVLQ